MTDVSRAYFAIIRRLPCAVCGEAGPSHAHHVRVGQGLAQRAGDFCTVPLCEPCHQGPGGLHGDRSRWRLYGKTEMDALDETIEGVFLLLLSPI